MEREQYLMLNKDKKVKLNQLWGSYAKIDTSITKDHFQKEMVKKFGKEIVTEADVLSLLDQCIKELELRIKKS